MLPVLGELLRFGFNILKYLTYLGLSYSKGRQNGEQMEG